MQLPGLTGEKGARFSGGLITDRDNQIERPCAHFIPGFAMGLTRMDSMPSQCREGTGVHIARRMTSRTPGLPSTVSQVIDEGFGHDGTARVARADNQNPDGVGRHQEQQPTVSVDESQHCGSRDVDGVKHAPSPLSAGPENISASSMVR